MSQKKITVSYTTSEALFVSENDDWDCQIDPHDVRCLRVTNKTALEFPDPSPNTVSVFKLDLGVRTALPTDYAVIIMALQDDSTCGEDSQGTTQFVPNAHSPEKASTCCQSTRNKSEIDKTVTSTDGMGVTPPAFPLIANGVIDAGYRGRVCALIYYDDNSRNVDSGGLTVRFALTKLQTICTETRMLFDLYHAEDDYECGFRFVSSVRAAADDSDAVDGEGQSPPDGNDVWPGTGCEILVRLRDEGILTASHFSTKDQRVAFIGNIDGSVIVGVRLSRDSGSSQPIGPVRFYTSGAFATLLPFTDTFSDKRRDDAGYDVHCPIDLTLEPMSITTIVIRQTYVCQDASVIPCVYGRSSLNSRGLPVIPTRWRASEWLTVSVCNVNSTPRTLKKGDRIAQLLMLASDGTVWLPSEPNDSDPFPIAKDRHFVCRGTCSATPRWRKSIRFDEEAGSTSRNFAGFGSTGS
nr:deoxyuridine triphosphatase UL50 [Psittacid alphaherpesvirus 6]